MIRATICCSFVIEFHTDYVRYLPMFVLITVQLKLNINTLKSGMWWIVVFFRRLVRWVKRCIFRKPQQLHEMQTIESSSDNLASLVTLE